jgi:hypothetical protein
VIHCCEDEASRRLRAEVGAVGLGVVDVRARSDDDRTTALFAQSARVTAALRLRTGGEIEVVILDEDGAALYWDFLTPNDEPPELFPIRAAEQLRAKLVKLQLVSATPESTSVVAAPLPSTAASSADAGEPPVERRLPASTSSAETPSGSVEPDRVTTPGSRHRLGFWAVGGAGGLVSAGGLGFSPTVRVGVRVEPAEHWGASLFAFLPVSTQSVQGVEGNADVQLVLIGALAQYRLTNAQAVVDFDVGLGGGAVFASIDGHPSAASDVGRSETVAAGTALASTSLGVRATRWLRLRADLLGGVAVPRPTIRFNGDEVASWGRPLGAATLSAEVSLLGGHEP